MYSRQYIAGKPTNCKQVIDGVV